MYTGVPVYASEAGYRHKGKEISGLYCQFPLNEDVLFPKFAIIAAVLHCVAVVCSWCQWSILFIVATLSKERSHWQKSTLHVRISMHCWHPI